MKCFCRDRFNSPIRPVRAACTCAKPPAIHAVRMQELFLHPPHNRAAGNRRVASDAPFEEPGTRQSDIDAVAMPFSRPETGKHRPRWQGKTVLQIGKRPDPGKSPSNGSERQVCKGFGSDTLAKPSLDAVEPPYPATNPCKSVTSCHLRRKTSS